jgi:hypothetical protein
MKNRNIGVSWSVREPRSLAMCGKGLITYPSVDFFVETDDLRIMDDGPVYEFPKRFSHRKRISLIVIPALFYGAMLVGILLGGPDVRGNTQLLVYLFAFLTLVMGFFMLLVYTSRPWIQVHREKMRVGGREFPIKYLKKVVVYLDRKMLFERPPYQVIFLVDDPLEGQIRVTSEAVRNVQDVDTIVRDLRQLLPDVEFVDRTLSGGSTVSLESLEAMGVGTGASREDR